MFYLLFGGILVFAGFYLIIKTVYHRTKGEHITSRLVGFKEEGSTIYPVFNFSHGGQEYNITGGVPAKSPESFKYKVGDSVNIVFFPSNTKYVDIEGSFTEILYGIGAIAGGAVFILLYCRQNGIL